MNDQTRRTGPVVDQKDSELLEITKGAGVGRERGGGIRSETPLSRRYKVSSKIVRIIVFNWAVSKGLVR